MFTVKSIMSLLISFSSLFLRVSVVIGRSMITKWPAFKTGITMCARNCQQELYMATHHSHQLSVLRAKTLSLATRCLTRATGVTWSIGQHHQHQLHSALGTGSCHIASISWGEPGMRCFRDTESDVSTSHEH